MPNSTNLLAMSRFPKVSIQVLPLDAGTHDAQQGGTFTLMKFPQETTGDSGLVYHELVTTGLYLEDPEVIAAYERTMSRLRAMAQNQEESCRIIQRVSERRYE